MERARKADPQALLALLAVALVAAAIWAATALAGGDSATASGDSGSSQPAAEFVQAEDDAAPMPGEDCPEEDGSGGSGGSGGSDDSTGSSSTDF